MLLIKCFLDYTAAAITTRTVFVRPLSNMTSRPAPILRAAMTPEELAKSAQFVILIREVVDERPLSAEKRAEIEAQTAAGIVINRENVIDIWEKLMDRGKDER